MAGSDRVWSYRVSACYGSLHKLGRQMDELFHRESRLHFCFPSILTGVPYVIGRFCIQNDNTPRFFCATFGSFSTRKIWSTRNLKYPGKFDDSFDLRLLIIEITNRRGYQFHIKLSLRIIEMELINFLFFSFDHHYDIYIITVSKKSGCVNLLTCIITFGMMILIARLYFYVHLFIENCERPVYVNERKKKIILFLISTRFHFRKNRLRKSGLRKRKKKKRVKNRFLSF